MGTAASGRVTGGRGKGCWALADRRGRAAALLGDDAERYRWAAAVVGSNNAAGYQLAAGVPVMAVGGFNGTDPSPTLEEFQQLRRRRAGPLLHRGETMMGTGARRPRR